MSKPNSNGKTPEKPWPKFPLYAHASGKWAKMIAGRSRYFGKWDDPQGALREYQQFLAAQSRGTMPQTGGLGVADACNLYLNSQLSRSKAGEISPRTYQEQVQTCKRLIEHFGRERDIASLGPEDFREYKEKRSGSRNLVSMGNEIVRIKTLFKWLRASKYVKDVEFGPEFKKASAKALRRHKRLKGTDLYSAEQVRWLLEEAGTHLKAMIYLGINCGFGNADVCTLPKEDVDLERGWIHYPRPKTEVERDIPLWPETIEALKASQACRERYTVAPENPAAFFHTRLGKPWEGGSEPLKRHFKQCLERSGIDRGGFYTLRHTFATVADGAKDRVAVQRILGHVDNTMTATYVEEIEPARLLAVTNHVRAWLGA